ncbi:hypothetical protein A4A49_01576 [Nicotiana attenuata]|uniref:Uncharacterized protein n=1 Tax=Nicotiana attenuata TaxID=49451 RepID=A0A1J6J0B2_NICAT|nr:hypothetical protein A4A49_01576 [Nicotiana attenuata]
MWDLTGLLLLLLMDYPIKKMNKKTIKTVSHIQALNQKLEPRLASSNGLIEWGLNCGSGLIFTLLWWWKGSFVLLLFVVRKKGGFGAIFSWVWGGVGSILQLK